MENSPPMKTVDTSNVESLSPKKDEVRTLKDSINEVLLSEILRKCLEQSSSHGDYFKILKSYQRAICLINHDVFTKFMEVKHPDQTSLQVGNALVVLFTNIQASMLKNEPTPLK